ncbi:hypothetical protein PybrP1_012482 [[Pythium] brassicae (nom. inval.)]|nr:hypothetical protein PybrP1_012482 [[Pythium] brassicae (nom. inval.)]
MLQRVFVWLYAALVFLHTRVRHKKWVALALVAVYVVLRALGKAPTVGGETRPLLINPLMTETKDDGIHMAPTPVLAPWTNHTFECVGWKRIQTCVDEGSKSAEELEAEAATREPEKDFLGCAEEIGPMMAGYCIVRNRTSGDLFKLMISNCDSIPTGSYTCAMARAFSEFGLHSIGYEHAPVAPSLALPAAAARVTTRQPSNGVIMIIYDKVLPSAYATIRMLRVQGCELPVELWYRPDEMSIDNPIIHKLLADFNVRMRPIFDARAQGFHVKPYAVYYSNFDSVLLLDADNLPAKDPTYLFDEPAFLRTGAIFWPDYWQPIKLDGSRNQPRVMTHIQEYALDADPKLYRIFQAVHAHKECCYYIGTKSLPDGRPAASITPVDATMYAAIEDLAIQFSIEARGLLLADAAAHQLNSSDGGPSTLRVQTIVALFLLAYVVLIIAFVWCKARPARERLPSRWKPMESKES